MKTCRNCNTEKSYDKFNKRAELADGHTNFCKECIKVKRQAAQGDRNGDMPTDSKKLVYVQALRRMQDYCGISDTTTEKLMERVVNL